MRLAAALLLVVPAVVPAQQVDTLTSGTTALLQAVSVPASGTVWVSGHRGTVLRSLDDGATWTARPVPGAERLQFRDIVALNADTAWILSAGNGRDSRIYRTTDGGEGWTLQFENADSAAFYDCLAVLDARTAVAFSDAAHGRTLILRTDDGGISWRHLGADVVPAPRESEGAFASSGGCVSSFGSEHVWVATGGPEARLFRSTDAGRHWSSHDTPFVRGASAGMTAVAFRSPTHGVAVAGRIDAMNVDTAAAAVGFTGDGGRSWTLGTRPPRAGALFGVAWVRDAADAPIVAVGPGGLFVSDDAARSWRAIDPASFWSVGAREGTAFAVGPNGRILRLRF
jgi:photosystem II stability/assembly factor-like uncharacterized protein